MPVNQRKLSANLLQWDRPPHQFMGNAPTETKPCLGEQPSNCQNKTMKVTTNAITFTAPLLGYLDNCLLD